MNQSLVLSFDICETIIRAILSVLLLFETIKENRKRAHNRSHFTLFA